MSRKSLVDEVVTEMLAEDQREHGTPFDMEALGNFFPEYQTAAADHAIEWDDDIWQEILSAYHARRHDAALAARAERREESW